MIQETTVRNNMEKRVKKELKLLASNRQVSGYRTMDIAELIAALYKVSGMGFQFDDNYHTWDKVTLSWLDINKNRVGIVLTIDWPDGDILEDSL